MTRVWQVWSPLRGSGGYDTLGVVGVREEGGLVGRVGGLVLRVVQAGANRSSSRCICSLLVLAGPYVVMLLLLHGWYPSLTSIP